MADSLVSCVDATVLIYLREHLILFKYSLTFMSKGYVEDIVIHTNQLITFYLYLPLVYL